MSATPESDLQLFRYKVDTVRAAVGHRAVPADRLLARPVLWMYGEAVFDTVAEIREAGEAFGVQEDVDGARSILPAVKELAGIALAARAKDDTERFTNFGNQAMDTLGEITAIADAVADDMFEQLLADSQLQRPQGEI